MALGPDERHAQRHRAGGGGVVVEHCGAPGSGAQRRQRRGLPRDAGEQPIDPLGGEICARIGKVEVERGPRTLDARTIPRGAPLPPGVEGDHDAHALKTTGYPETGGHRLGIERMSSSD